jgi:sortase A
MKRLVEGRTLGEVPVTITVLLFPFVAWQLWWTDVNANREQAGTIQGLEMSSVRLASPSGSLTNRPPDDTKTRARPLSASLG